MTYSEFEQKVKRKTCFDKYWYYGLCIAFMIISFILLFPIITRPDRFKDNYLPHYSAFLIFLFFGTYGLYKLPNRYKIVTIDTSQSLTKKKIALEMLFSQMNIVTSLNDNYCSCKYREGFWSSAYDLYFFYDEETIRFSVQGQDSSDGGFIDLGGTEKLRRKIADDIQTYLV